MKANDLLKRIREQLGPIADTLRNHPYLASLNSGQVPMEALKALPGHQYHMAISDLRSLATMIQRFGDTPQVDFFNGILQGQLAERDHILAFASALGMTTDELDRYDIQPEGFAYSAYLAWLASYGSAAEIVCSLMVNFPVWGENCRQVGADLRVNYGFAADDTVFFDSFVERPSIEGEALKIIQHGLDHGVAEHRIMRAARLIQFYEGMFWDAMAKVAAEHSSP